MQPSEAFVQSTGPSGEGCSEAQSTVRRYSGGLSASSRSRQGPKSPTSLPLQNRLGLISLMPMARPPFGAISAGAGLAGGLPDCVGVGCAGADCVGAFLLLPP